MSNEQKVIIDGEEYTLFIENGNPVLKRYDKEYKMWIELEFLGKYESESNEIAEYITQTLSKEYIESMCSTLKK